MSWNAFRPRWQLGLAAAAALAIGSVMPGGLARADDATTAEIKEFQRKYVPNLAYLYQQVPGDLAPSKDDLIEFTKAYIAFAATPKFAGPAATGVKGALDDATARQASLKTMQYLALRNRWLRRCLIAIVIAQAPNYCHQFSPYSDKLLLPADIPKVATRSAVTDTGSAGDTAASRIDSSGPLNYALLLQNADVAIVGAFSDTLKKLEKEEKHQGQDLLDYLVSATDDRVQHLILSVLSDADISPDPKDLVQFLKNYSDRAGRARYFFIQKAVVDPSHADDAALNALAAQLTDTTEYSAVIKPLVLNNTLNSITSLTGVKDYSFIPTIANLAVSDKDPNTQAAASALLTHFVSLIAQDKPAIKLFAEKLQASQLKTVLSAIGSSSTLPAERKAHIAFLAAIAPILSSDPNSFPPDGIVSPLLAAFGDKDYQKKNATSRIEVANVLASMKVVANTGLAYETLQNALFAGTADEQAAFLAALGAMTSKLKDD